MKNMKKIGAFAAAAAFAVTMVVPSFAEDVPVTTEFKSSEIQFDAKSFPDEGQLVLRGDKMDTYYFSLDEGGKVAVFDLDGNKVKFESGAMELAIPEAGGELAENEISYSISISAADAVDAQ